MNDYEEQVDYAGTAENAGLQQYDQVHHNFSSSPTKQIETGNDTPLPYGWVEYLSEEGYPYFYHAETHQSSWQRPTASPSGTNDACANESYYENYDESYNAADATYQPYSSNEPVQEQEQYFVEQSTYISEASAHNISLHEQHSLSYSSTRQIYDQTYDSEISAVPNESTQQSFSLSELNLNMESILDSRRAQHQTQLNVYPSDTHHHIHGSVHSSENNNSGPLSAPMTAVTAEEFFSPFSPFSPSSAHTCSKSVNEVNSEGESGDVHLNSGMGETAGHHSSHSIHSQHSAHSNNNESTHSLGMSHSLDLLSPYSPGGLSAESTSDRVFVGMESSDTSVHVHGAPSIAVEARVRSPMHIEVTPAGDLAVQNMHAVQNHQLLQGQSQGQEDLLDTLVISPFTVHDRVFTFPGDSTGSYEQRHGDAAHSAALMAPAESAVPQLHQPSPQQPPQQALLSHHMSPASMQSGESEIFRCLSASASSADTHSANASISADPDHPQPSSDGPSHHYQEEHDFAGGDTYGERDGGGAATEAPPSYSAFNASYGPDGVSSTKTTGIATGIASAQAGNSTNINTNASAGTVFYSRPSDSDVAALISDDSASDIEGENGEAGGIGEMDQLPARRDQSHSSHAAQRHPVHSHSAYYAEENDAEHTPYGSSRWPEAEDSPQLREQDLSETQSHQYGEGSRYPASPNVTYGDAYPALISPIVHHQQPPSATGITDSRFFGSPNVSYYNVYPNVASPPVQAYTDRQTAQEQHFTSPTVSYDHAYPNLASPPVTQYGASNSAQYPPSPNVSFDNVYPHLASPPVHMYTDRPPTATATTHTQYPASPNVSYDNVYPNLSSPPVRHQASASPQFASPEVSYDNVYPTGSTYGSDAVNVNTQVYTQSYDAATGQGQQEGWPEEDYNYQGQYEAHYSAHYDTLGEQQPQATVPKEQSPEAVVDNAGGDDQAELDAHQVAWLQYEQMRDSGTLSSTVINVSTYGGSQEYLREHTKGTAGSKYSKFRSTMGAKPRPSTTTSAVKTSFQAQEEEFYEPLPETPMESANANWQDWVQCVTAQGDVYYYNSVTQHVQWESPFESARAEETAPSSAEPSMVAPEPTGASRNAADSWTEAVGTPPPITSSSAGTHSNAPASGTRSSGSVASIPATSPASQWTPQTTPQQIPHSSSLDAGSLAGASGSVTSKPKRGMVTHNTVAGSGPQLRQTRASSIVSPAAEPLAQTATQTPRTPQQPVVQQGAQQWGVQAGAYQSPQYTEQPPTHANQPVNQLPPQHHRTPSWGDSAAHSATVSYPGPQAQFQSPQQHQQSSQAITSEQYYTQYTYPAADLQDDEGEPEGGSTVGSPLNYNRYTPLGLRTSTVSISSLSDNDNSEYGFTSSVQGSVQGAFVMHHPQRSPSLNYTPGSGGSGDNSPIQSAVVRSSHQHVVRTTTTTSTTAAAPPPVNTPLTPPPPVESEEASQASTESQTQRHLEIWDRFFRNAMLVNQANQDGGDGPADEAQLSQAAVKASIRKIRQKAAMSRSKGATAVARWPHLLSSKRYTALVSFALRQETEGQQEAEQEILDSGSVAGSVNSIDGTLLSMALLAATLHEDVATVEALLHNGANPSCVDDLIRTPAHYACKLGNVALLALLCDHDAELEATDAAGRTPLHTASIFGRVAAMEFLLGCAVDCNAADLAGNTALHLAARAGFEEGCRVLLNFGASTVVRNLMGMTALGVAQIMRPQSAALQSVIAVLANPLAELPASYDQRQGTVASQVPAEQRLVQSSSPQTTEEDAITHHDTHNTNNSWQVGEQYRYQDESEQAPLPPHEYPQDIGVEGFGPQYTDEQYTEEQYQQYADHAGGADADGHDVNGEGVYDSDDGDAEGSSVADLVASSVWGVAASLIDITLSMFSAPSGATATTAAGNRARPARNQPVLTAQRVYTTENSPVRPLDGYEEGQRPLRLSAPVPPPYFPPESPDGSSTPPPVNSLWQLLGLGAARSNAQPDGALSREQTESTNSLSGLAGGPPTDQELSARGMGFPVRRPPFIPELSEPSPPSSPPRSPAHPRAPPIKTMTPPALVAREIDQHIRSTASTPQRQTPPTPPSEVMIAVAISKAEQQRHMKPTAGAHVAGPPMHPVAGISMMDERPLGSRAAAPLPLPVKTNAKGQGALTFVNPTESLLHSGDGPDTPLLQQSPATSIVGRKSADGKTGILKGSSNSLHSNSAGSISVPGGSAGVSGATTGNEGSLSSPPTSGNGYSIGASLPRGVTWRYVDVLNNQS